MRRLDWSMLFSYSVQYLSWNCFFFLPPLFLCWCSTSPVSFNLIRTVSNQWDTNCYKMRCNKMRWNRISQRYQPHVREIMKRKKKPLKKTHSEPSTFISFIRRLGRHQNPIKIHDTETWICLCVISNWMTNGIYFTRFHQIGWSSD